MITKHYFTRQLFVSGLASKKKGLGNVYTQEMHSTWLPPNKIVQINIFLKWLWTSHIKRLKNIFLNIQIRPTRIVAYFIPIPCHTLHLLYVPT